MKNKKQISLSIFMLLAVGMIFSCKKASDTFIVEISPLQKISAHEAFSFAMKTDGCEPVSEGIRWEYGVDHKIFVNGEDAENTKGIAVKIDVEIRQKSTGETLYSFDIAEDLDRPCGMNLMGESEGTYEGCKPFDDGDYEYVITAFSVKKGRGKFKAIDENLYELKDFISQNP